MRIATWSKSRLAFLAVGIVLVGIGIWQILAY